MKRQKSFIWLKLPALRISFRFGGNWVIPALFIAWSGIAGAQSSTSIPMERVEVAPDQWTFRTAETGQPFVPYGVNYTPAWSGWAPDYFSNEHWDEKRIDRDFATMQHLGVNICKVAIPAKRILLDPQTTPTLGINEEAVSRVRRLINIAGNHGIRIVLTMELGWLGWPNWFHSNGRWFSETNREIISAFWRRMAEEFRGDGRVFAYSFCVETELAEWSTTAALAEWRDYARSRYGSLEEANRIWKTDFTSWEVVRAPGFDGANSKFWQLHPEGTEHNENNTNDPFLYDYLLFREYTCFRNMHRFATAVKEVDPKAMCTMGYVQWNPLLRAYGPPQNDGPVRGAEYNVRESGRAFDYIAIHFYPIYPDGGDDDNLQLRYLELWSRWSHIGKPVVLEEFNGQHPSENRWGYVGLYLRWFNSGRKPLNLKRLEADPKARNLVWCPKVFKHSQRYLSGWMVWTFQDVPDSDDITKVCGLLDAKGRVTAWGEKFRELAPAMKRLRLVREAATRTVEVDKRFLYTSGRYQDLLNTLLDEVPEPVDFVMESNSMVDRLLGELDRN